MYGQQNRHKQSLHNTKHCFYLAPPQLNTDNN